jgi:hypothetical protein
MNRVRRGGGGHPKLPWDEHPRPLPYPISLDNQPLPAHDSTHWASEQLPGRAVDPWAVLSRLEESFLGGFQMRITAKHSSTAVFGAALLLVCLVPRPMHGQSIATFQHIVIVVQENRTPDNLFGSTSAITPCNSEDPFEPGVDIKNCGYDDPGKTVYYHPGT